MIRQDTLGMDRVLNAIRVQSRHPLSAGKICVTARVISGVASHIQVEQTEALHVSWIALMVREYLRSECVVTSRIIW